MSKILKWAALTLIFLTVIIPSCSKKKSTQPKQPDTIISDKVRIPEEETGVSLDTVKDSTYTFKFTGKRPKISKDDILTGTGRGGYLRRVMSVTTGDSSVIIETGYAVLTDAIIKGSLDTTVQLSIEKLHKQTGQGLGLIYAAKGVSVADGIIDLSGVELFQGKIGGADVTVSITEGSVSFDPSLDLGLQIENSGIKEFHTIAKGVLAFNCDLGVTASRAFTYSNEVNIATFKHTAVQFVGPVPIVEVITLSFDAGFESEISIGGTTEFGFESSSDVSFGARYRDGVWSTVWDKGTNLIQHPVVWEAEAGAEIRGYIKPSISVELYSVAGPYLEVEPYLGFTGQITSFPLWYWYWRLYGGIGGDLGFQVSILNYELVDYSTKLLNWEITIAGDSNSFPNTPSSPSPSDGATGQSIDVDLSWTGGDPDADPVTYDIYFGTNISPPLVVTGRTSTLYDPSTLKYNTKYYWKIVSKDNRGGQTTGPVWNFTTGAQPNNPPNTPSNPSPSNGATNQSIDVDLSWTGGDPDGDPVTYDVYFGTSSSPPLVATGRTSATYDPGPLLKYNTKYYWKIVSKDNRGGKTTGPVWNFTTGAQPNNPPNTPGNPSPSDGATKQSIDVDLSWTGGDPDGDPVTYDVYFGTSSSPPLVATGRTSATYDPGTLDYNTEYYWKIVSKDNRGGQTTGPVWSFTTGTQSNNPPNTPSNPSPSDNATNQSKDVDLSWTGGDPDGDPVTYDVYFGTSSSPPLVATGRTSASYDPGTLSYNTKYYWKIVSYDNRGGITSGPVWNFTTGTQPNNPPNTPSNPSPSDNATNQSKDVDLSWTGGDPDGDPVAYDVYFGTSSSPPLVATGRTSATYDPGTLSYNTEYYWKIVAKDNRGGQTTGPVWNFTTTVPGGNWTTYNASNSGLADNTVSEIAVDASGNKWVGTQGGVSKFDGTNWTTYNTSNSGLADDWVEAIAIDASGNKWFGGSLGVSKFDGTNWTTYNTQNSGLAADVVDAITIDASGNKWFGTHFGGVSKFDGTNWTTYNTSNSGLAGDEVVAIAIDHSGNKWFGTLGNGVSKFAGINWITYDASNSGLSGDWVYAIAIDALGNKWFGTNSGVSKFDGTNWTTYNASNSGLAYNYVDAIAIDGSGNKWFGTGIAVSKFDGTSWTTYDELNSSLPGYDVVAIAIDASGNKWFGTWGGGVSKFHE